MSSLQYRKDRMTTMANQWGASKVNDLFIHKKISDTLYNDLRTSIGLYISKALHFEYTAQEVFFALDPSCAAFCTVLFLHYDSLSEAYYMCWNH